MADERYCAVCERMLGEKDSEHVCRDCFRRAREPKIRPLRLSDAGAERLGFALALGDLLNWGVQKLVESAGASRPAAPAPSADEGRRMREELATIQRRLKKDSSEKGPSGSD